MAVTARRAKKKRAPQPVVYEDDDDDDEEEGDFVPGQDDDDDLDGFEPEDDDDDDEDDNVAGILEGTLHYDEDKDVLHYQGDTFHLSAEMGCGKKKSADDNQLIWNPLRDPPLSGNNKEATYQMKGTMSGTSGSKEDKDDEEKDTKPAERIFNVTWTIRSEGAPVMGKSIGEDDDDEEDGKQKASPKRPALFYNLVGKEVVKKTDNVLIQFEGGFYPPSSKTANKVPLNCQIQYVIPETRASVAAAAVPIVAVATAAAASANDDDDDEADEGMGYDELIALHEDANVNVEELKRRYQGGSTDNGDDEGKPSAAKKLKPAPKDDSDDDVGF